jgi:hypothetical protein
MSLLAAATLGLHVWAVSAGGGAPGGLEIEAGTPDDLCPTQAATEAAVRGRLGGVLGRDGEGAWKARYSTWYAPEALGARVLRIEILDPGGRVQQTKDLQTAGATCESLATAIAVVVESHFRRPDPEAVRDERPPLPLLSVSAGAATQTDGPAVGAAVEVGVRVGRRATLIAGTVLPRRHASQAVGAGTAELRGLPIRLGVGFDLLARERWRLDLGPEALLLVDSAETRELAETRRLTRLVFGLGAAATARVVLGAWSLGLTGSLVATLPLEGSELVVAQGGGEAAVLAPPAVVGRLALSVGYGFFFSSQP